MPYEDLGRLLEEQEARGKRDPLAAHPIQNEQYPNGALEIGGAIRLSRLAPESVMILEDEFKSSYDCTVCKGTKKVMRKCLMCDGTGISNNDRDPGLACGRCDGTGEIEGDCEACKGKGSIIVIPEEHKTRPTSGVIYAIGSKVTYWAIGDRVVYSGYTGHLLPFKGNTRIRVMGQKEPFCLVESIGTLPFGTEIQFIDKDSAYDLT